MIVVALAVEAVEVEGLDGTVEMIGVPDDPAHARVTSAISDASVTSLDGRGGTSRTALG